MGGWSILLQYDYFAACAGGCVPCPGLVEEGDPDATGADAKVYIDC